MWKLNVAIATAIIVAAIALVATAKGATSDCQPFTNAVSFNADFGLEPYLLNIGTPSWAGKQRLAMAPNTAACDPNVQQAVVAQQRFYTLLRAFPQNPTRAQWKVRYQPLMQAAIATDTLILAVVHGNPYYYSHVTADKAWLVRNTGCRMGQLRSSSRSHKCLRDSYSRRSSDPFACPFLYVASLATFRS